MSSIQQSDANRQNDFAAEAGDAAPSLAREIIDLLRYNKKWWLVPIVLALVFAGVLVMLGGTAFAPFIYPLF